MNYIKKSVCLLIINAASIITSNAADNKSMKDFEALGPIVRTQNEVQINWNGLPPEVQVVVFPTINELADMRSCMQVCTVFYGEFKRIIIERMDFHNLEYKVLPPFFVKFVLNFPGKIPVKTEDKTTKDTNNQNIIFTDKYNKSFKVYCGKVLNGPLKPFKYPKLGDLNSALTDLKDADLHTLQSFNQKYGRGGSNTKTSDTPTHTQYGLVRLASSVVSEDYVLKFNGNEYLMNFCEFIPD